MKRALRTSGGLLAAALLGGCAPPRQSVELQGDMPASPDEIAKWRDKNGLAIASEEEVALAKQCEARLVGQQAVAANGGLKIAFKLGSMVGSGYSNLSTTSTYLLIDANTNDGKVLKRKFENIEEHFPFPFTIG